jgi:hypothetical protein
VIRSGEPIRRATGSQAAIHGFRILADLKLRKKRLLGLGSSAFRRGDHP